MAKKEIPDIDQIDDIPKFMKAVKDTYGVDVPVSLGSNHPLSNIFEKAITVTEESSPDPRYTATGSIGDEFPFNFAQSADPKPVMNLKIDVFESDPGFQSRRGVKVTVFHVPGSTEVIVRFTKDVPSDAHVDLSQFG